MKVILLQNLKNIGQKGQVKDVSEGYFRNFLSPRNLAIVATDKQVAHVQVQKAKSVEKLEAMRESALSIKEKIDGKTVRVQEKASESGRLYRAVNEKIIAEAVEAQLHASIPANTIKISEHFKNLGEYKLSLSLYKDVSATINLTIEAS